MVIHYYYLFPFHDQARETREQVYFYMYRKGLHDSYYKLISFHRYF